MKIFLILWIKLIKNNLENQNINNLEMNNDNEKKEESNENMGKLTIKDLSNLLNHIS